MTELDRLVLRPLRPDDEASATAAHTELAADDFTFLLGRELVASWTDYLTLLTRQERGEDEREDRVPATFLAVDVDGQLVGRVSIRHELNAFLAREGGHLGYAIRPGHRRRGFATRTLTLAVDHLAARGVTPALVTCDDDNLGSVTVIERAGGVLRDRVTAGNGRLVRRYDVGGAGR